MCEIIYMYVGAKSLINYHGNTMPWKKWIVISYHEQQMHTFTIFILKKIYEYHEDTRK